MKLHDLEQVEDIGAYADDLAVILAGNTRNEMEHKLNLILCEIAQWCIENKLNTSIKKTNYLLLRGG